MTAAGPPAAMSKGGFYWHFASRGELLDAWEHASVDDVIASVDGGGGTTVGRRAAPGRPRRP